MKIRIVLSMALLTALVQVSSAATSISLEPNNILKVSDAQGALVATVNSGSISEKVSADNQIFQLSYGQDLQGRNTVIIYPDPASPQSLDLLVAGQSLQMSQDSVLTLIANDDGSSAQFQAGVLGEITLAGAPIAPGSSLSVENGQMISTTPSVLMDDEVIAANMFDDASAASSTQAATNTYNSSIEAFRGGMVVKQVTGTAMMAPEGGDVMDLLRNSDGVPKLKKGDVIPEGATIRTDYGGELIVAQSPGVTFQILPNSNLEIEKNDFSVENGVEKRSFDAKLSKGGIISHLEGVDRDHTDYSIKTPLAVAAARGTAFAVYTSSGITVAITATGSVEVTNTNGDVYTATAGNKAITSFTPGGGGGTTTAEFDATSAELQAIQSLISIAQSLNAISTNPDTSGSPTEQLLQDLLDQAVLNFQNQLDPTLNPGAITPTISP